VFATNPNIAKSHPAKPPPIAIPNFWAKIAAENTVP
jgi:hypothetical protein